MRKKQNRMTVSAFPQKACLQTVLSMLSSTKPLTSYSLAILELHSFKIKLINKLTPPYKRSCWDWLVEQVWCSKVEQGSSLYDSWNTVKDPYKCHSVILWQRPPKPYKLFKIFFSFSVKVLQTSSCIYTTLWKELIRKSLQLPIFKNHRNCKLFRMFLIVVN